MRAKWIVAVLLCVLCVGCQQAYEDMADPNSSLNVAIDAVGKVVPAVGAGAAALGLPWLAAIGNGIVGVIALYKNYRKKLVIGQQDEDYGNLKETTSVIVKVVDKVADVPIDSKTGETIGDAIKGRVKEGLKDNEIFKIGKAIIDGLKME